MPEVVLGGAFQSIHPGHLWLMKKAKELGRLTVVVASDKTVMKRKALLMPQSRRIELVRKTGLPDRVVAGGDDREETLLKLKPDIVVLGYDQEDWVTEASARLGLNVKVIRFKKYGNYSTGGSK